MNSNKEHLKAILLEYQDYERALLEEQIANGAPRPEDGPRFSFARFFNWLFELENK